MRPHCPIPGCHCRNVAPNVPMCHTHWHELPAQLRADYREQRTDAGRELAMVRLCAWHSVPPCSVCGEKPCASPGDCEDVARLEER